MTAQLDVEALVGLLKRATAQNPLPWAVKESDGEYDEAWCPWYDLGPLNIPGEKPDAVGQLMIAAVNAPPALLAHIAGEPARVAAAVAVERERCAQIAERLSGDDSTNRALNERICCSGVDCGCMGSTVGSYLEWHLANAIRNPAIGETPSAE